MWRQGELESGQQWGIGGYEESAQPCVAMMMSGARLLQRIMFVVLCWYLIILVDTESHSHICDLGSCMRPCLCLWAMLIPGGETHQSSPYYHLKPWWYLGLDCHWGPYLCPWSCWRQNLFSLSMANIITKGIADFCGHLRLSCSLRILALIGPWQSPCFYLSQNSVLMS